MYTTTWEKHIEQMISEKLKHGASFADRHP